MRRRVLFVSYAFPPVGGAGVQRTAKFVKYLPSYGWLPSVLTVANPSVPVLDGSISGDIPDEVVVRRARTREPGYHLKAAVSDGGGRGEGAVLRSERSVLRSRVVGGARGLVRRAANLLLQPDAQILWAPDAIRQGGRLLREIRHDAVVASGPPFSSFLIGAALARRVGLPLVLDYRDEWNLSNDYLENRRPDPLSRQIQRRLQGRVVRAADALVATTHASSGALEKVRDQAGSAARVAWIYNGYDPDDFIKAAGTDVLPHDAVHRVAYVGTLWNLTSAAPLVAAVEDLALRRPDLMPRLELIFAGRRTAPQQLLIDRLKVLPCRVTEHPYVDHCRAVELLLSSDTLCALLSDLPHAGRVMPAKLFEYMAARKAILAIAPRGEMWEALSDYPGAATHEPGDVAGISGTLERAIEQTPGGLAHDMRGWDGSRFDRRKQAGQLAELLDKIVAP